MHEKRATTRLSFFCCGPCPHDCQATASSVVDDLNAEGVALVDLFHNVDALSNLPKAGVVAVEVCGVFAVVDNEELRSSSVSACMGHAEHTLVVVLVVAIKLAINGVSGASASDALRTPSLSNKPWNDPVEFQPFVEALLGELDEVGHCVGGILFKKFHGHAAVVGVNFCLHGAKMHHVGVLEKPNSRAIHLRQRLMAQRCFLRPFNPITELCCV